jgi:hypothetical protein
VKRNSKGRKENNMRTLLTAVALATILTTPALANKTPVKTVDTCNEELMLKQMIYHLGAIEMMIKDMRADALRQYPKKPVKDAKTSG